MRKNPLGVLRAFQAAFPDRGDAVALLVKTTGLPPPHLATEACQDVQRSLQAAAAADERIRIIDRILSRDDMLGLIEQSGCFVSLHRSEGFGLGMAEAMALGTPVIGTDYSGNRDFLTEGTGFPVGYSLCGPFGRGTTPATRVRSGRNRTKPTRSQRCGRWSATKPSRSPRASAAKALIQSRYGRETVGHIAGQRLEHLLGVVRKARMH